MQISKLKTIVNLNLNDILPALDIDGGVSGKPILGKTTIQSIIDLLPDASGGGGNNSGGFSIPTTIKTVAANNDYFIGIDVDGLLYKITKADLLAGLSNNSSGNSGGTEVKLIGTPFGELPVYAPDRIPASAFDGNLTTSYNYYSPSGGYVGLDLGSSNTKKLSKVRIYPRQEGVNTRSSGAKIQGSNQGENSGYTDLFTFGDTTTPGIWYESGALSILTAYQYLRYVGVSGTYSDVCEVEFYGV